MKRNRHRLPLVLEKEELKEFWEACGGYNWVMYAHGELPDLTLDSLFKYGVSKLMSSGYGFVLSDFCSKKPFIVTTYGYSDDGEHLLNASSDDTPELALYQALRKVLIG